MSDQYTSIWCNFTENSTDIVKNTSNVTVSLICSTSGWAEDNPNYWLTVNGSTVRSGTRNFDSGQTFTLASWTGDVPHNDDGTGTVRYQGYFQGTAKPNPGNTTIEYSQPLTTISRTSEILDGAIQRAIDEGISFSIDKKNQDFSDKLTIYPETKPSWTTEVSPYATGSTLQIDASTLASIKTLAQTTTYTSMVVQVETFASGTSIGSTSSVFRGNFTAAPPSITPIWSASPTYENVTGHDNVTISLGTNAMPNDGTTISAYEFTIGSTTLTTTTYSIYFPDVEDNNVSVKIIDRRGLSTTVSTSNLFGIVEYSNPTMIGSINRYPDLVATGAQLNFSGTYTFVNEDITDAGTEVSYKINNGNWTTLYGWTIDYSGNYSGTITFPSGTFDAAQNHVVYVRFNDSYEVIEKRFNLSKAAVTLDMDLTNQRVGIGQPIPEDTTTTGSSGLASGSLIVSKNIYAGKDIIAYDTIEGDFMHVGADLECDGTAYYNGDVYKGSIKQGLTTLWTNTNRSAAFSAQTVVLTQNYTSFDMIIIRFQNELSGSFTRHTILIPNSVNTLLSFHTTDNVHYNRRVELSSRRYAEFKAGFKGTTQSNEVCIPLEIFGVKF